MRTQAIIFACLLGLVVPAAAQFKSPEAVVEAVYGYYTGKQARGFPRSAAARFFEPSLLRAWNGAKQIDYDYFIQGQDFDDIRAEVAPGRQGGGDATVAVRFKNFDEDVRLTYELVKTHDGWRIKDVRNQKGKDTFRQALSKAR